MILLIPPSLKYYHAFINFISLVRHILKSKCWCRIRHQWQLPIHFQSCVDINDSGVGSDTSIQHFFWTHLFRPKQIKSPKYVILDQKGKWYLNQKYFWLETKLCLFLPSKEIARKPDPPSALDDLIYYLK